MAASTVTRALDPSFDLVMREGTTLTDETNIVLAQRHAIDGTIPVVGYIHEEVNYPSSALCKEEPLHIAVPEYGAQPLFAFRVRGAETDFEFEEDCYVIALPITPGDVVFHKDTLVVRRENGADMLETVLMDAVLVETEVILETRVQEESLRTTFNLSKVYDAPLTMLGVVIASFGLRKPRFGLQLTLPSHVISDGAWKDARRRTLRA